MVGVGPATLAQVCRTYVSDDAMRKLSSFTMEFLLVMDECQTKSCRKWQTTSEQKYVVEVDVVEGGG